MPPSNHLLDYYLPPQNQEGFSLESLVAITYQVNFQFLEDDLLASALGVGFRPAGRSRSGRNSNDAYRG